MWDPYVPKRGVPTGCRVGCRTPAESFVLTHAAKRESESLHDPGTPRQPPPHLQSNIFENGCMTVRPDEEQRRLLKPAPASLRKDQTTPFGGPDVQPVALSCPRPLAYKISAESIPDEPIHKRAPNPDSLVPMDNLGPGLAPYVDRVMDTHFRSRIDVNRKNIASTPDGPIAGATTDISRAHEIDESYEDLSAPTTYIRRYGVGVGQIP